MEDFFGNNIDLSELTEKAISLKTYTPKLLLLFLLWWWVSGYESFCKPIRSSLGKKDPR